MGTMTILLFFVLIVLIVGIVTIVREAVLRDSRH
jgi:hypothetical protein